jgi:hypothetical protein
MLRLPAQFVPDLPAIDQRPKLTDGIINGYRVAKMPPDRLADRKVNEAIFGRQQVGPVPGKIAF